MPTDISSSIFFLARRRGASKRDRRMDGYFVIGPEGFACRACSGSRSLAPLPAGTYQATRFRERSERAMVRDGVGFSIDLSDKWDPSLQRTRRLLRIHPDGGDPGTEGCVGILTKVKECRDLLARHFPDLATRRSLEVIYVDSPNDMTLVTSWGAFVFG